MSMRFGWAVGLVILSVTACKLHRNPPGGDASVSASTSVAGASPSASALTDQELGEQLEQAFSAQEKAHPGPLPKCGPGVKGPCSVDSASDIALIRGDKIASQGDKLPPAIHGHGEALRGAWVAPDGTEFLVGYNYTGVPGPDTGVVYRKDPGGEFQIVYSKKENELGHIWGRNAKDVWAAGVKTLAHFDGTSWKEEPIPVLEGNLAGVWGNETDLYVVGGPASSKGDGGRIFRRDAKGAWTVDGHAKSFLFGVSGKGSLVFAVGQDGQILRRTKANAWTNEGTTTSTNEYVYVANEHDIFVAGSALLRSKGDGTWTREPLPTKSQARNVWGRSATDVYVGTLSGLYHLTGTTWGATAWQHEVEAISGNGDVVLVANQRLLL